MNIQVYNRTNNVGFSLKRILNEIDLIRDEAVALSKTHPEEASTVKALNSVSKNISSAVHILEDILDY